MRKLKVSTLVTLDGVIPVVSVKGSVTWLAGA